MLLLLRLCTFVDFIRTVTCCVSANERALCRVQPDFVPSVVLVGVSEHATDGFAHKNVFHGTPAHTKAFIYHGTVNSVRVKIPFL